MVASQSRRSWEPDDQPMSPNLRQYQQDIASKDPTQPTESTVRWPFHDADDDKQPPPPPQPPQEDLSYQDQPPIQETPEPGRARLRCILSYWGLEILTVFMAFCLLAAIIALLAYYDGHYMPEWPFEINLNSAIALLSTFLRAAIVAAVAEIIGQIKWTWFAEKSRPLQQLQDFDGASRSVLGSIHLLGMLVWNLGFTSAGLLAIAAALVTIASLAVGPVTQQAVRTSPCSMLWDHARATMPAAHYVPGSSAYYRVAAGMYQPEVDMKSAMIKGITDPGSQDNQVKVGCVSGNCTWPDWGTGITHSSIGMCSSCLDTTKFVSPPDSGGNLTLPDQDSHINILGGNYMWIGYSNLTAYTELFTEEFSAGAFVSMANFSMLMVSKAPCTSDSSTGTPKLHCPHRLSQGNNSYYDGLGDYIAASCILYPCLKEFNGSYDGNVLREKLIRTTPAVFNDAEQSLGGGNRFSGVGNYTAIQSPCVLDDGTWYDVSNQSKAEHVPGRTWTNISLPDSGGKVASLPNACLYKMDGIFFRAMANFLSQELLSASCRYDSMQSGHLNCFGSWWLTPLWADMNATVSSVTEAIDSFAWAVTNKFRMTGLGPDVPQSADSLTSRGAVVLGDVLASTTCTYFDQKYIVLPTVLVVICAALLAWVILINYYDPEQPVWKGSVLPLLFFGLNYSTDPGPPVLGAGSGAAGAGGTTGIGGGGSKDSERWARNMTFFGKSRRTAPELNRIQRESGRMWVRFKGGLDPGFLDLGTKRSDPEAANAGLLRGSRTGRDMIGSTTAR
ncbi:uncharacterized protein LY79DRAFT_556412 [Colletotrichum navitas]|uniref:Uncharacterized protein n=1 Tax=Colletotrichum navitas TaxID=681940 RepID=A0AAD8V414_9PEZI|nr:uncharacterized protein LY79DRAFT_556412 [Colletotrichum navitas]KAK1589831.1 hypothetical protein LY79DRAFT_556412 [Colletotrichum navitas]